MTAPETELPSHLFGSSAIVGSFVACEVGVAEEAEEVRPATGGDVELVARISLRLPEPLKAAVEAAAAREGVSVNTWLVRSITRLVSSGGGGRRGPGNRLTGFGRS